MKALRSVIDLVYQSSLESADQLIQVLHVDEAAMLFSGMNGANLN